MDQLRAEDVLAARVLAHVAEVDQGEWPADASTFGFQHVADERVEAPRSHRPLVRQGAVAKVGQSEEVGAAIGAALAIAMAPAPKVGALFEMHIEPVMPDGVEMASGYESTARSIWPAVVGDIRFGWRSMDLTSRWGLFRPLV